VGCPVSFLLEQEWADRDRHRRRLTLGDILVVTRRTSSVRRLGGPVELTPYERASLPVVHLERRENRLARCAGHNTEQILQPPGRGDAAERSASASMVVGLTAGVTAQPKIVPTSDGRGVEVKA
jgi:hypothetical protein